MSDLRPYRVLITDFLEETSVEKPVLVELAELHMAHARTEADLYEHLPSADAILLFHELDMLGEETFSRATKCRGLVRAGVGFNNVDLEAAGRHGIAVCNVPDYGTEEVADHAILLLLAVVRQLLPCDRAIRDGDWSVEHARDAFRLRGKTLGIVGCGRIGTATVLRAKAFGLDVVIYDPHIPPGVEKALGVRRVNRLEELLVQSKIVSLHCYLDARSYHLIDAKAIATMPAGSILINTARGPVIDQNALVAALEAGHIAGAGLDVLAREPLDDERLRRHPRTVFTPHSAFYSVEGYFELRRKAAEEVRRLLLGESPLNLVNRAQLVNPRVPIAD